MTRHTGLSGKGTPGRSLESAADRQAETTGGLNYAGTDVNRDAGDDINMEAGTGAALGKGAGAPLQGAHVEFEPDKEATQGDAASGDLEGGSSLSVGMGYLAESAKPDFVPGGPILDSTWLDSLFDDLDFPCEKEDVLATVANRDEEHPESGIDIVELIGNLSQERFMNPAELNTALHEELDRRARVGRESNQEA